MWSRYALDMAYELARELIGARIGNISHLIGVEEGRGSPDTSRISELEQKLVALAREREELDPKDGEKILCVIERYRRFNPSYERILSVPIIRQTRGASFVRAKARAVFGDRSKAENWLSSSSAILRGVPLTLIDSKDGRRLVYDELVRIDVGDFT